MSTPKRLSRVSASSVKALTQCSLAFYYERVLGLPTKEWPRTIMGTLAHSLFECLRRARHRHHYDAITTVPGKVDWEASPVVARLVRWYKRKHGIGDDLIADLNGMLEVGMLLIDYHWTQADLHSVSGVPLVYGPEHEFLLKLDDDTQIKGFIDDMAVVGGIMRVRDYKSARNRFTASELPNNVQAALYQLYIWHAFQLPAEVHFIALRHPPTKRTPQKHLQIVPPASPAQLAGLETYVKAIAARVRQFTMEDAMTSPCDDLGFCQRVCTHYAPHPYWIVCRADDPTQSPVSSHLSLDKAAESCDHAHIVIERSHPGCLAHYRS